MHLWKGYAAVCHKEHSGVPLLEKRLLDPAIQINDELASNLPFM